MSDAKTNALLQELNDRLASMDGRLERIEERQREDSDVLDNIDTRMETVENVLSIDVDPDADIDAYPGDL